MELHAVDVGLLWPSSPSPLRMLTLGVWDFNDSGDSLKAVHFVEES